MRNILHFRLSVVNSHLVTENEQEQEVSRNLKYNWGLVEDMFYNSSEGFS